MKLRGLFLLLGMGLLFSMACGSDGGNESQPADEHKVTEDQQPLDQMTGPEAMATVVTVAQDTGTVLALAGIDRLLQDETQNSSGNGVYDPTFTWGGKFIDGRLDSAGGFDRPDLGADGLPIAGILDQVKDCVEATLEAHSASLTLTPGCVDGSGSILLEQDMSDTEEVLTLTVNVVLPDQTIDGQLVVTRRIASQTIELVGLNLDGNTYSGSITLVRDALNHRAVTLDVDATVDGKAIIASAVADLTVSLDGLILTGAADVSYGGESVADVDFDIQLQRGCELPDATATAVIQGATYGLVSSCDGTYDVTVPDGVNLGDLPNRR